LARQAAQQAHPDGQLTAQNTALQVLSSSEPQFIYLRSGHKYFKVDTRDILYAESLKDYVHVHTREKSSHQNIRSANSCI
jgi:DNA-binding LytR/AlgR family response regulator